MYVILLAVLLAALAAANGANDDAKGVATLIGTTRYRTSLILIWGVAATLAGSLLSGVVAGNMTKLFSKGIVSVHPTNGFTGAVIIATILWIALATLLRLPVSTTHALVGALIGAGLATEASAVHWGSLSTKVISPMLLSVLAAYLLSAAVRMIFVLRRRYAGGRAAIEQPNAGNAGETLASADANGRPAAGETAATATRVATAVRSTLVTAPTAPRARGGGRAARVGLLLHWLSGGATSLARGLNDTPKLVAIGSFALVPAGVGVGWIVLIVGVAMAVGGLIAASRVANRLGKDVVRMSHNEGLSANMVTAILVGAGAHAGLPMSTTHVSASAIAGSPGITASRVRWRTVRDFLIAWTLTPLLAGVAAYLIGLAVS